MLRKRIEDLEVYDPKSEGIDFKEYYHILEDLERGDLRYVESFKQLLVKKVLDSTVDKNEEGSSITLGEYLSGEGGYFPNLGRTVSVVFMDGKFHSQHEGVEALSRESLEKLSMETGAVPFVFSYSSELARNQKESEFENNSSKLN